MTTSVTFPTVEARNLQGLGVTLPSAFEGDRNVVIVAFKRDHQNLVDSWLTWLEAQAAVDPGLRFYEVPTIGRIWAPVRTMIDGGMARAIKEPVVLQRTLTLYGDVNRLTRPLAIGDTSTIAVFLVDADGLVLWSGAGPYADTSAAALSDALHAAR